MGLCSVTTRQNAFSWFALVCFSSAVRAVVGGAVELQKMPRGLTPHCGDNVTLRCEASLLPQEEVKLFSLGRPNMSCQHGEPRRESWCESAGEHPRLGLTLTLVNVMPVDQGQYLCKLRSTMGVYYNTSALTVQDCIKTVNTSLIKSHATCCFSGVYPTGVVHWSRGEANLTELSRRQEEALPDGRYNICSRVEDKRENISQSFQCSLWLPSHQMYLAIITNLQEQKASGGAATLQGNLILLGMVVLALVI